MRKSYIFGRFVAALAAARGLSEDAASELALAAASRPSEADIAPPPNGDALDPLTDALFGDGWSPPEEWSEEELSDFWLGYHHQRAELKAGHPPGPDRTLIGQGGDGRGQGRAPLSSEEKTVYLQITLLESQRDWLKGRDEGASAWVRAAVEEARAD